MTKRFRILLLCLASLSLAPAARANDFIFSQASFSIVGPALLIWLVAGLLLSRRRPELIFMGTAGWIVLVFCAVVTLGHFEFGLYIWMIYLAIVTVHVAFARGLNQQSRRLNLLFHGSILALVLVGGGVAKYFYWNRMGGYASWSAWMEEIFPGFFVFFSIFAISVGFWMWRHPPLGRVRSKIKFKISKSR